MLRSAYRGWRMGVKGPNEHNCACGQARFAGRGPQSGNAVSCEGGSEPIEERNLVARTIQGRGAFVPMSA